MNVAVRYYTRSGNTEKLAKAIADEEFRCRGSFGPMHKDRPNSKDLEEAQAFAQKVMSDLQ